MEPEGKLNFASTSLPAAVSYAQPLFQDELYRHMPHFDRGFCLASARVARAKKEFHLDREGMPVLTKADASILKRICTTPHMFEECEVAIKDMSPTQDVIWYDVVIHKLALQGTHRARHRIAKSGLFVDGCNKHGKLWIIDGHHRWGAAMLIASYMKVRTFRFRYPVRELIKDLDSYTELAGRQPNA